MDKLAPARGILKGALIGVVIYLIGGLAYCNRSHAHDHEHPELNNWYQGLHSSAGSPCCDEKDFEENSAKRLTDADWDTKDGHYRVRIDGQWVDVPETAHVLGPNRDGRPIVWFYYLNGMPIPRCFIPGAGG